MSVQITLSFPDAAAAAAAMARLAGPIAQAEAALAQPVTAPAASGKPKAEKPAAPASKPVADAAATSSAATPAAASEPKADKPAVLPYDALRVRVVKLASLNKDAVAPILAHFGVDHFTKVAEERRAEALELVNAALAQLEAVA